MSKIDQFVEMQAQILEYFEARGDGGLYQVSISMDSYPEDCLRIEGSAGSEGDQWSDDCHEHCVVTVPLDFFENFDVYLKEIKDERLAEAGRQKAHREELMKIRT